jgi:hypothetical protein
MIEEAETSSDRRTPLPVELETDRNVGLARAALDHRFA